MNRMITQPIRIATILMRGSLWLLLPIATLFAADALAVGLTFGFDLWKASDPFPTILWIAVLIFPLAIMLALKASQSSVRTLTFVFCACWAFIGLYLAIAFHG